MSSPGFVMQCPGCGTAVEHEQVQAQFVGDLTKRPLRIGRCVAVGVVLGLILGVILGIAMPHQRLPDMSLGALLGILMAILLATRYNEKLRATPVDRWPNSISCPRCGRVFGRYQEGDEPPVRAWP